MKTLFFNNDELKLLEQEIVNGYVSKRKHPEFDLWIYNYTPKTQYEWHWNNITEQCRGLILDINYCLVAKGFNKFFTLEQLKNDNRSNEIPNNESFEITNKIDGSLGILYFYDDNKYISTRGSFESEMAVVATEMLNNRYNHIVFYPEYSYLFEIIYPENRIVVDYGNVKELVLIGVVNNLTGDEYSIYDSEFDYIEEQGLRRTELIISDKWETVLDTYIDDHNMEGVVVHFLNSHYRVKLKLEWYKHISHIIQNLTKRGIWKKMREFGIKGDGCIEDILGDIPDELYPMVQGYVDELYMDYDRIMSRSVYLSNHVESLCVDEYGHGNYTDKEYYHMLTLHSDNDYISIVMMIHKGKDPFMNIWKMLKDIL